MCEDVGDPVMTLTPEEAARVLGFKPSTLKKWRTLAVDSGPKYLKCGRQVRYRYSDLWQWIHDNVDERGGSH